jgi:cytochrome oxidase Cu insertion factor (SCO1/SenC/PrrC family)
MTQAEDITEERKGRSGRSQLVAILLAAGLSMAGAYLVFFLASSGGVWGTTNNGEFVTPATTMDVLDLRDAVGAPVAADGHWWLWTVAPAGCGDQCRFAVERLRQVHALLNKDASRVRRALITAELGSEPPAGMDISDLERLVGRADGLASGIYIVDPIGNLVLRYPLSDAGEAVLEDLKRLLKVSQIG